MKRRSLASEVVFSMTSQSNSTITVNALRHRIEPDGFQYYEALAACRESGQIDDETWEVHLADDDFAAWYLVEQLNQ